MRKIFALLLGLALCGPALAVDVSTVMPNANYTALSTDVKLVTSAPFTAARTLTLPAAGATCIGQTCPSTTFEFFDAVSTLTGTNTLTITPATGDTINGSSSSLTFGQAGARITLWPLSGTNWYLTLDAQGANLPGTSTNDNACAGCIGEVIQQTSIVTSAPLLVTTVPATVTQVLLTAGDWDCRATAQYIDVTSAGTQFAAWTSTTSLTYPTIGINAVNNLSMAAIQTASITSPAWVLSLAPLRISLAASTSVFLTAADVHSSGNTSAAGFLQCRRAR